MNAAQIGNAMFSHTGIFFLPEDRSVVAVFPYGAALPLRVEPGTGASVARRTRGAKWTFRKGPFFSREHRR